MQNRETEEKTLNIYIFPSVQMITTCHFLRNNDANNFTYLILIIYLIFYLYHIILNKYYEMVLEIIKLLLKLYTFSNLKTFNQFNFKI